MLKSAFFKSDGSRGSESIHSLLKHRSEVSLTLLYSSSEAIVTASTPTCTQTSTGTLSVLHTCARSTFCPSDTDVHFVQAQVGVRTAGLIICDGMQRRDGGISPKWQLHQLTKTTNNTIKLVSVALPAAILRYSLLSLHTIKNHSKETHNSSIPI